MTQLNKTHTSYTISKLKASLKSHQLKRQTNLHFTKFLGTISLTCLTISTIAQNANAQDAVTNFDISDEFDLITEIDSSNQGAVTEKLKNEKISSQIKSLKTEIENEQNIISTFEQAKAIRESSPNGSGVMSINELLQGVRNFGTNEAMGIRNESRIRAFTSNSANQTIALSSAKSELESKKNLLNTLENKKQTNTGFWDSKTIKLSGNLGIAINPNKKTDQEGDTDIYFNPIIFTNFSNILEDTDGNANTSTVLSLSSLLYAKDHFEDVGSDVEVSGLYGSYTRIFDRNWTFSVTPGVEIITSEFYSDRLSWDIPIKFQINRKFYKKPKKGGELGDLHSQASLRFTQTLSNPSTGNRQEIRLTYSKSINATDKWKASLTPMVKYTSYSNLPNDAKLNNTDFHLALALSRLLSDDASLVVKGEIGQRESSDSSRDSNFADLPLSISLKKKF